LKVVYPICCGIDVHKTFLVATLITTQGIVPSYKKKRFSTFNNSILAFKQWLIDNNCFDVCMESTGKYYIPVYNLLEDSIHVTVANPKWVAAVKGNKDDVKDSKWIGDLFLREYTRYRFKLVSCKSSEKNRFQNAFTVCNVALDAVVSDMFGKSASSITNYLVNADSFDPKYCISLLQRSLKKKADEVIESIEGFQMTGEQKERIRFVRRHLDFVEQLIADLDQTITGLVEPFESAITLLCTIPGVDRNTAITILSEIGTDRAGVYLKPALVQAAHAAVKSKTSSYYRIKYERIAKRRGKKRAIIAIARMMLTAVYHMLQTGEVFNPCDLFQVDIPIELRNKQKEKALRQAAKLLITQGVISPQHITLPA